MKLPLFASALAATFACVQPPDLDGSNVPALASPDPYTLRGERSFKDGYPARNEDGTIHVVIEIPAGDTAKWEVDDEGILRWEHRDGEPRVVRYLGYPGNYGMVPRTLLPTSTGGDGDPLDVLVLGASLPRGAVVRARVLGVLRLVDGGEQDDKLLAVTEVSPLAAARDVEDLARRFPGSTSIVETWFTSYKGPGRLESKGFGGVDDARRIVDAAVRAFEER